MPSIQRKRRVGGNDFSPSRFKSSSEIQYVHSLIGKEKSHSLSCMGLVLKTNNGSAGALTFTDLDWGMCGLHRNYSYS